MAIFCSEICITEMAVCHSVSEVGVPVVRTCPMPVRFMVPSPVDVGSVFTANGESHIRKNTKLRRRG